MPLAPPKVTLSLDTERWQKIGVILTAVLEYPTSERQGAMQELCEGDEGLAVKVGAFLEAHEQSGGFPLEGALSSPSAEPELARGEVIGPYEVVAELGRGGMGEVYLAQRADQAYERQVAIKVIKRGMDSKEIVQRFFRERRILASLDHSGIARLLDGGSTTDDRPYFVMEYIEGQPIDEYIGETALPIRSRLELFRKVCAAVDHAHRQLVVHRDLKPANILVDAQGEPKLLDFGIAKLLASDPGWAETRAELRPMTLKYSSPEQVRGDIVTAAVDIHALGLLLYELLVGKHPYGSEVSTPEALRQAICRDDPMLPSRAVNVSSARRLERQLKGDLDAIVFKALRKDPQDRYPSVASLDEDVRRHLDGEPVGARKGTNWYRVSKFVRRNWRLLALFAGVLGLVGFFIVNTIRQSQEVASSTETARRTAEFMVELFSIVDPSEARGQEITAREILDRGVERIETDLVDEPEIRAELTYTMGQVYGGLGLYEQSRELFQAALLAKRAVYGDQHPELIEPLLSLAEIHRDLGKLETAERQAREGLEVAKRAYGDKHPSVPKAMNALALVLWNRGNFSSAETFCRQALIIGRELEEWTIVGPTLNTLGLVLASQGNFEGAEAAHRESLSKALSEHERDHPMVLVSQNNLASVLIRQEKGAEAEPLFRQVIATRRLILSEDHPDIGTSLNNFAMLLHTLERNDEAEPVIREALGIYRRSLGEDHAGVTTALYNLAEIQRGQGQWEEALNLYLEVETRQRKASGDEDFNLAFTLSSRANLLMEMGDDASAVPLLRETITIYENFLPDARWRHANTQSALGECLTALRRYQDAELLLLESLAVLENERGPRSGPTRRVIRRLSELYEAWGQPDKASPYRDRLEDL